MGESGARRQAKLWHGHDRQVVDNNHIESSDVTVYWTQRNPMKRLRPKEYEALRERCRYAQHPYTVGWYSIRQYFWGEGRCLRDESNDSAVKDNANWGMATIRKYSATSQLLPVRNGPWASPPTRHTRPAGAVV